MSFGGAPSLDFEVRVEGVSWWRAELPAEEEVDAADAAGPCDILLLHDSPDSPYATSAVTGWPAADSPAPAFSFLARSDRQ